MIDAAYTLFTRIPIYTDDYDLFVADDLWAIDLLEHFQYISNFRICCPVEPLSAAPASCRQLSGLSGNQVTPIRPDRGWGSVVRNVVPNFCQVVRAVRRTRIAHSSGAGWAFPLSYYLLLLRRVLAFKWIIVIESSFWMAPTAGRATIRQRLSHYINRFLIRRCVKAADARIFTQEWYREELFGSREATLINPAIWVNEADLLAEEEHSSGLAARSGQIRIVFAARLVQEKGVETVLAAARALSKSVQSEGVIRLDIIGSGPLLEKCRSLAEELPWIVRVLDPVPYGRPFLHLLRGYDAVLLANRQAEQPRIVADAFSQGVPCIASRTVGVETMVTHGDTGLLFEIDDVDGLARHLCRVAESPELLRGMSRAALRVGRLRTHRGMHRDRHDFLVATLGQDLGRASDCRGPHSD